MILEWVVDAHKYQFKTIYKLSTSVIDIEILWDDVEKIITSGSIIVSGLVFRKITDMETSKAVKFKDLNLEEAKLFIMLQTMQVADFISISSNYSSLPYEDVIKTFEDLTDTYMHYKVISMLGPVQTKLVAINTKQLKMVEEFERANRHHATGQDYLSENDRKLRVSLIEEEYDEFRQEHAKIFENNIAQKEKGLDKCDQAKKIRLCAEACDLKYVVYTTLISYGLDFDEKAYKELYTWVDNRVRENIGRIGVQHLILDAKGILCYNLLENEKTKTINTNAHYVLASVDYFLEAKFKNKHQDVFAEIHRANMSKSINGVLNVREDGKILKGPNYRPPDFSHIFPQPKET